MNLRSDTCSCSYVHYGRAQPVSRPSLSTRFYGSGRSSWQFPPKSKRKASRLLAALSPDQLHDMLSPAMDHLFLAYERVVMPCHNMNCGDVVHRRFALDINVRYASLSRSYQGMNVCRDFNMAWECVNDSKWVTQSNRKVVSVNVCRNEFFRPTYLLTESAFSVTALWIQFCG